MENSTESVCWVRTKCVCEGEGEREYGHYLLSRKEVTSVMVSEAEMCSSFRKISMGFNFKQKGSIRTGIQVVQLHFWPFKTMITSLLKAEIFNYPCSYFLKKVENDPVVKKFYYIDSKLGQLIKIQGRNRATSPIHEETWKGIIGSFYLPYGRAKLKLSFSDSFPTVQHSVESLNMQMDNG